MITKTVTIKNRAGIHARPAALIAQTANRFSCKILIEREDTRINAKSIMGVMTLGASFGTQIRIIADGADEKQAVASIEHLFATRFEED